MLEQTGLLVIWEEQSHSWFTCIALASAALETDKWVLGHIDTRTWHAWEVILSCVLLLQTVFYFRIVFCRATYTAASIVMLEH